VPLIVTRVSSLFLCLSCFRASVVLDLGPPCLSSSCLYLSFENPCSFLKRPHRRAVPSLVPVPVYSVVLLRIFRPPLCVSPFFLAHTIFSFSFLSVLFLFHCYLQQGILQLCAPLSTRVAPPFRLCAAGSCYLTGQVLFFSFFDIWFPPPFLPPFRVLLPRDYFVKPISVSPAQPQFSMVLGFTCF